jgi:hypothetical protein
MGFKLTKDQLLCIVECIIKKKNMPEQQLINEFYQMLMTVLEDRENCSESTLDTDDEIYIAIDTDSESE